MEQIEAAREWWRQHRDKAPFAFDDDLEELIERLEDAPTMVGRPVGQDRSIRRAYLPRIRYAMYFQIRDDHVLVFALWHGSRQPPHWHQP